ncbi:MAG: hypothetical protein M3R15_19805 [Acidobacteriota bacterium]|nr:hypothetical protein [Acidobacteriota bacterium]
MSDGATGRRCVLERERKSGEKRRDHIGEYVAARNSAGASTRGEAKRVTV